MEGDEILFQALSFLYEKHENLFHTLFYVYPLRLADPAEVIKANSLALSQGEQLLVRIGLDIWDQAGGIHFNELYQKLDYSNFQKVLLVLNYLRSPGTAGLF